MERPHEYIYMDEAGFNLTKRRRRGRKVIGHRAIVGVPGQRGGNVTLCAAISKRGVVNHHANLLWISEEEGRRHRIAFNSLYLFSFRSINYEANGEELYNFTRGVTLN